jgi:hypothetical protein
LPHLLCVGGIISLSWFSKELKRTYRRTTNFMASSLYFSFANQYLLGGVSISNYCWCLGTSYLCVALLSNLIYFAFRELVHLRGGCGTTGSWGLHHLVSELGSINQIIPFWNFRFLLFPQKFLSVQFFLLLKFVINKKLLFGYVIVQNISVASNRSKKRLLVYAT